MTKLTREYILDQLMTAEAALYQREADRLRQFGEAGVTILRPPTTTQRRRNAIRCTWEHTRMKGETIAHIEELKDEKNAERED